MCALSANHRFHRFQGYDYSRGASLFITIVTEPRKRYFGAVENGGMRLNDFGQAVWEAVRDIGLHNPGITRFAFVVMPDHVHFNLHLRAGLDDPLRKLGNAINGFKSHTLKLWRQRGGTGSIWQTGYHDRLCSTRQFIDSVTRYINYNPLKFELRRNHPEYLAIHEPLDSPRLDSGEFWRGIGETGLLAAGKMAAVRISRKVAAVDYPTMTARFLKGSREGWVFIGGWISPGEKALRDALLANGGRVIQLLPSMMPHDYMPSNFYFDGLYQRRALILAKGNDEITFNRAACLDLNATAARIADSAIYWR